MLAGRIVNGDIGDDDLRADRAGHLRRVRRLEDDRARGDRRARRPRARHRAPRPPDGDPARLASGTTSTPCCSSSNDDPEGVRQTLGDLHDLRMLLEPEIAARAASMATRRAARADAADAVERMEELEDDPDALPRDRRRLPQRDRGGHGQRRARVRARLGARAPAREPARHEPDQRDAGGDPVATGGSSTRSSPASRRRPARRCARTYSR